MYEPWTRVIGDKANCYIIQVCLGPGGNCVPPDRVDKIESFASRSSDDIKYML